MIRPGFNQGAVNSSMDNSEYNMNNSEYNTQETSEAAMLNELVKGTIFTAQGPGTFLCKSGHVNLMTIDEFKLQKIRNKLSCKTCNLKGTGAPCATRMREFLESLFETPLSITPIHLQDELFTFKSPSGGLNVLFFNKLDPEKLCEAFVKTEKVGKNSQTLIYIEVNNSRKPKELTESVYQALFTFIDFMPPTVQKKIKQKLDEARKGEYGGYFAKLKGKDLEPLPGFVSKRKPRAKFNCFEQQ